jgi:pantothenate synthetase
LSEAGRTIIAKEPQVRLDYFELVDPDSLEPVDRAAQPTLVAVAAFFGPTRLLDNVVLTPGDVKRDPR